MTAFTLRQLDRTRQPGYARLDAGWSAPAIGAAKRMRVIGVTFAEFSSIDGRDAWPGGSSGAVAVSRECAQ
jgi:hypothetical protein